MALIQLPPVLGLRAAAIAGGVALVVGFSGGVWVRGAFCDAAAASLQNKSHKLDVTVGDKLEHAAETTADELDAQTRANLKVIREIEATRPPDVARACRLSADDVRRLRSIK